jgi:hypothetical protein
MIPMITLQNAIAIPSDDDNAADAQPRNSTLASHQDSSSAVFA